jgi:glycosyltransferase involved in cell wall biosynthesis
MNPSLSIIVPVYNVEKYIRPCIESIFRQGLDEECFEVIIVNDGTKDRSIEVIQDIISQHQNITVIHQENQGLSVVRNNGIAIAKGEYILMPDSDDLLIENSIPPLLEKALEFQADLVVADFLTMNEQEIANLHKISQKVFHIQEKTGEELFLEDLSPYACFVWHTLFRRNFLLDTHLKFIPGIYIQDVPFTHECYLRAKKCLKASWYLNIYRRHESSATFFFNKKKEKDFCTAIAATWRLTDRKELSSAVQQKLREDVYISFSAMVSTTIREIKKTSDRMEIADYLRKLAPDLSFNNGRKQTITSFLFRHMPHTYMYIKYIYAKCFEDSVQPFYRHYIKNIIQ